MQSASKVRTVGTIKLISGTTVTLTTDSGAEVTVGLQPSTRLLRMAPGQTDLKQATSIQAQDLQVGDRLLAGGTSSDGGKSVTATTAVVMTKADVAAKQERDREDWQKRGVGGVVKTVDAGTRTITISTGALGSSTLAVRVSSETIIRRYALDSVKFDDAKPGTLDQIKAGDQLRARGTKNAEGTELAAEEIVSGTFRNVAGLVVATDSRRRHCDAYRPGDEAARDLENHQRLAAAQAAGDDGATHCYALKGRRTERRSGCRSSYRSSTPGARR